MLALASSSPTIARPSVSVPVPTVHSGRRVAERRAGSRGTDRRSGERRANLSLYAALAVRRDRMMAQIEARWMAVTTVLYGVFAGVALCIVLVNASQFVRDLFSALAFLAVCGLLFIDLSAYMPKLTNRRSGPRQPVAATN